MTPLCLSITHSFSLSLLRHIFSNLRHKTIRSMIKVHRANIRNILQYICSIQFVLSLIDGHWVPCYNLLCNERCKSGQSTTVPGPGSMELMVISSLCFQSTVCYNTLSAFQPPNYRNY